MQIRKYSKPRRYLAGFALGLLVFVGVPEGVRWFHGGAIAQQALFPNSVTGTTIQGQGTFSATGSPGQTGPVVGGESNVTVCPGQNGQTPSVVGTHVPPGSSLSATASGGGGGSVTGYRSTVTVGGADCK